VLGTRTSFTCTVQLTCRFGGFEAETPWRGALVSVYSSIKFTAALIITAGDAICWRNAHKLHSSEIRQRTSACRSNSFHWFQWIHNLNAHATRHSSLVHLYDLHRVERQKVENQRSWTRCGSQGWAAIPKSTS